VAEPTIDEAARLLRRMNGTGTVKRLSVMYEALRLAYRVGRADESRTRAGEPEAESALEG